MRNTTKTREDRLRRIRRTRGKIFELNTMYLMVHRTANHIYAQVFSPLGKEVLASASSLEKAIREQTVSGKVATAEAVGHLIAERAKAKGIARIAFDRSGNRYHGRVKALAEAARSGGLIA